MGIDNLMVTLYRVPEIKAVVDTGTDWVTLFGFLLTAIAVVAGAIYNTYTFNRSVAAQERIAGNTARALREQGKSEYLAKSRQELINNLREEIASFLAIGHDVRTLAQFVNDASWVKGDDREEFDKNKQLYEVRYSAYSDKLARARFHYAKIELFLNPIESESVELLGLLHKYIAAAADSEKIVDIGVDVVKKAQLILKAEWAKVLIT